jgi:hypothetical protein
MTHDDHSAQSHEHGHDAHEHAHDAHEHGHDAHEHGPNHAHEPAAVATPTAGPLPPDLAKVAILVNNWIDHNEAHRRTYLEWREKIAAAGVPATVAALSRIADLTDEVTAELRVAAAELEKSRPAPS